MKLGRTYRGIEFVRLSDLPAELRNEITQWIDPEAVIKIRTDEGLFRDCILTKDFQYWLKNIHEEVKVWEPKKVRAPFLALNFNH